MRQLAGTIASRMDIHVRRMAMNWFTKEKPATE